MLTLVELMMNFPSIPSDALLLLELRLKARAG